MTTLKCSTKLTATHSLLYLKSQKKLFDVHVFKEYYKTEDFLQNNATKAF